MSDLLEMPYPLPFITFDDNKFHVVEGTKQLLSQIHMPIIVVAIVGPYRTGKSYLMNRLCWKTDGVLNYRKGFELGSTLQSHTKGIWIWCRPHPTMKNHCLVLLDTEGLGDAEKSDPDHDNKIFSLAILLSSILVYNSIGKIDQGAIDGLHVVTNITEHVRAKRESSLEPGASSSDDDSSNEEEDSTVEYGNIFPDFVWVLRDFFLDTQIDGNTVTADEYLDRCLTPKPEPKGFGPGMTDRLEAIRNQNLAREQICAVFPNRKCLLLCRPVDDDAYLSRVNNLEDDALNTNFIEAADAFCYYILRQPTIKKVTLGDKEVTADGSVLVELADNYVSDIISGGVPCVESALERISQLENQRSVELCLKKYDEEMRKHMTEPLSLTDLDNGHTKSTRTALDLFTETKVMDTEDVYLQKLQDKISSAKENCIQENGEALDKLFSFMIPSILDGYSKSMAQCDLPMANDDLDDFHQECCEQAFEIFDDTVFKDMPKYEQKLQGHLQRLFDEQVEKNDYMETQMILMNKDRVDHCLEFYKTTMEHSLTLPCLQNRITESHETCMAVAVVKFMDSNTFHRRDEYLLELTEKIQTELACFISKNETAVQAKEVERSEGLLSAFTKRVKKITGVKSSLQKMQKETEEKMINTVQETKELKTKLMSTEQKVERKENTLEHQELKLRQLEKDENEKQETERKLKEELDKKKQELDEVKMQAQRQTVILRSMSHSIGNCDTRDYSRKTHTKSTRNTEFLGLSPNMLGYNTKGEDMSKYNQTKIFWHEKETAGAQTNHGVARKYEPHTNPEKYDNEGWQEVINKKRSRQKQNQLKHLTSERPTSTRPPWSSSTKITYMY